MGFPSTLTVRSVVTPVCQGLPVHLNKAVNRSDGGRENLDLSYPVGKMGGFAFLRWLMAAERDEGPTEFGGGEERFLKRMSVCLCIGIARTS